MIVKANTKYGDIYVSDVDHIGKTLISGEFFEDELVQICLSQIKDESNVLDIGANVGSFSLAFLNKPCRVHAFEPQGFLINLLKKTFKENDRINIHHNAVGLKSGIVTMNFMDDHGQFYNPSVCKNLGGMSIGTGGEEVNMIRIDDLNIQNISLIKIDVEGYESQVINGARKTIIREKPFIVFESHHLSDDVIKYLTGFLENIGYKCEEKVISNLRNCICTI